MKKITKILPEIILIAGVVVYWEFAGWTINPIAIVLILLIGINFY